MKMKMFPHSDNQRNDQLNDLLRGLLVCKRINDIKY